jgi:hypothetical protein
MKFSDTGLVRLEPRARVYLRKPVDLVFQKTRMLTCQYLLLLHLLSGVGPRPELIRIGLGISRKIQI